MAIHKALPIFDRINFKVVGGTTPPTNPIKNTFWVNTNTPIHYWSINSKEPYKKSNNKNLFVYPFYHTTITANGITFTDNKDGSVKINGTATSDTYFRLSYTGINHFYLPKGTYTLSGATSGSSTTYQIEVGYSFNGGSTYTWKSCRTTPTTFTINNDAIARCNIKIMSGATISNVTVKPQLEKSSSATAFIKGDATGQIWIQEKSSSPIEFNSLKTNAIMNQPYQIKQYVNGAWAAKTGRFYKIPSSYQNFGAYEKLDYIQTTGTQYIDTDITVFNQSAFKIEYVAAFSAVNYNYNNLWCSTSDDENYQAWVYSDGRLAYKWGSSTAVRSSSVKADTSKHTYTFDKNGSAIKMFIDDVQKLSSTNSGTLNKPMRLFHKGSSYGKAKIYEIKIYVSGVLTYHLVPARRISDSAIGLRDILKNKFYTNAGTGTFGAGSIKEFID